MRIRLDTRNAKLIAFATITQTYVPPEVVMWRGRPFIVGHGAYKARDGMFVYYEATYQDAVSIPIIE